MNHVRCWDQWYYKDRNLSGTDQILNRKLWDDSIKAKMPVDPEDIAEMVNRWIFYDSDIKNKVYFHSFSHNERKTIYMNCMHESI